MKVGMKTLLVGGVVAVIAMLIGAGVVWAVSSSLNVPASVTVTPATTTIKAYNDSACTSPLTTINFGSIQQGTDTAPKTIYVRNEGTVPVRIVLTGATGLPAGVTLVNDPQPARDAVPVLGVEAFTVSLHAAKDATTGSAPSITINFTSE